jgi:hypothetical protein
MCLKYYLTMEMQFLLQHHAVPHDKTSTFGMQAISRVSRKLTTTLVHVYLIQNMLSVSMH